MRRAKNPPLPQYIQLVAGLVVPTIILMTLSDESRLGPLAAMLLALTLPIVIELYSVLTGRKASFISFAAIVGIVLVGMISLFGLSEEWLAARRAVIYVIAGLAIIGLLRFKPSLLKRGLNTMIDMNAVEGAATKKHTTLAITRLTTKVFVTLGGFMLLLGAWSYLFTVIFITAPTGSSEFNTQYAELRIISLFTVTLPLLIGMVALLVFFTGRIEKLTGLSAEELFRKKQ